MTRITQQQLESYLWGAAVLLRGTIDAGDYKQFIFPLLFYKRLCDVFDEETVTALRESGGDQDFALFPENHRFQVPADAHWREIRKVSRDVGRALQQAMRTIETANPDKLFGIFGDAQWTNKDRLSDAMLRDLIEHFSSLELTVANLPEDELGQGYEYLIKKFADDSGHTAAEFYTNRTVVHLMTEMLDVQPGESVYDPTCGSGGMLLSCIAHLRNQKKEWRNVKLYGQERNLMTSSIARMNCFLHGIEDFRIERGDTLAEPKLVEGDRLMRFDVVLANPPYSIKQWDRDAFASDPWGRNLYGTPPQGRADYAFQQHILQSLRPKTGRCAVLWPHGVLFRQEEAEMRRKLIEADLIECVVGLGPNLFYNSAMDSCVVICRTDKPKDRRGKILLIDAKDEVTRDRTQSFLTPEHLSRIIRIYRTFEDESHFSRVVSLPEVRANEGNLNIALYIDSTPKAAVGAATREHNLTTAFSGYIQSSASVRRALATLLHGIGGGAQNVEETSRGIVLPNWLVKSKWKRVRLGDVAVRDAGKMQPDGNTVHRWVAADHIDEGDIHVRRWSDTNDPLFPPTFRYTFRAGNVLLHSRNPRKVVIPRFDGITGEKLFVLKARNTEVLREDILAFLLMSSHFSNWVSHWMSGSVNKFLNWSAFEKFEFDLPPLDQQHRIAEILWSVDQVANKTEIAKSDAEKCIEAELHEFLYHGHSWPLAECRSVLVEGPRNGYSPPANTNTGRVPTLSISAIRGGKVIPHGSIKYADVEDAAIEQFRLKHNDILVVRGNGNRSLCALAGLVDEFPEGCFYPDLLIRLRFRPEIFLPEFAVMQWNERVTHNRLLKKAKSSNGISKVNGQDIKLHKLLVPPINEQRCFLERVNDKRRVAESLDESFRCAMTLQTGLINSFFS